MTSNEFPAEPFSVRATEPRTLSHLLASPDPAVRALAQSIRNGAEAYFARYLEAKGIEYRTATHRSSLFEPHTHTHLIIANPPTD